MIQTAVILAAGKSTRMYPLTLDIPKPLLKVLNISILERNLQELQGIVEQVYIVVGYKKQMIQEKIGDQFGSLKIFYEEQEKLEGSGSALLSLQEKLEGKFLVFNGDDLYKKEDILHMLEKDLSVLAQKVPNPSRFGVFKTNDEGKLLEIVEKPTTNIGNLVNAGAYLFDQHVFEWEPQLSVRGEIEITDMLLFLAKKYSVDVIHTSKYWFPIGFPWDLLRANFFVMHYDFEEKNPETEIPENVTVRGPVHIGKKVKFGKNIQIIGPVVIGDNVRINEGAYILPYTCLEDDVVVDDNAIVAESVVTNFSMLKKNSTTKGAIVTEKYTIAVH